MKITKQNEAPTMNVAEQQKLEKISPEETKISEETKEKAENKVRSHIEIQQQNQQQQQTQQDQLMFIDEQQKQQRNQKRTEEKLVRNLVYKRKERVIFKDLPTIFEEEEEEIKIKKKKLKLPKLIKMRKALSSFKKKGAKVKRRFKNFFA